MAKGTVKWFNTVKGYGFISPEDGTQDVFVHATAVNASGLSELTQDQTVYFDIAPGRNGRQSAENLRCGEK